MSSTDNPIYDIIFVGGTIPSNFTPPELVQLVLITGVGGATACVTAGRLAEADPSLKILVSFKEVWSNSILLISKSLRS